MAAAYGPRPGLRKAVALLVPLLFLVPPLAHAAAPRLLVLGDSLTAGYELPHADGFQAQLASALQTAGHPVQIVDGSVSGDTSAGGLARMDWVLADGADAAIVELGANDALRGVNPAVTQANLTKILDTLQSKHIPVLLAGMYAPPNMGSAYAQQFRDMFARLGQRPGILFEPFFLDGMAEDPRYTLPDHLHPNPAGVKLMVGHILPLTLRLLAEVKPT